MVDVSGCLAMSRDVSRTGKDPKATKSIEIN
jgi:hypothetical protein